ncbi:hypothetical protein [Mesorhizobium amorphae]|nr:hypothetical protein [Mesorhizobium amorphae]
MFRTILTAALAVSAAPAFAFPMPEHDIDILLLEPSDDSGAGEVGNGG